jgi:hypothetical protein
LLIIGAIQETLYSFAVGFGTIGCPASIVV